MRFFYTNMFSNFSESMKNNKTILYNDACPLCSWYTGAFVKTGLLDKEGRKAFSTASPELLQCIDRHRGKGTAISVKFADGRSEHYAFAELADLTGRFANWLARRGIAPAAARKPRKG